MHTPSRRTLITVVLIVLGVVIGLGLAYGFERWQDFDRLMDAREAAPDKEEFDRNFDAMAEWIKTYKEDHPGATDEDASRAFDAAWEG